MRKNLRQTVFPYCVQMLCRNLMKIVRHIRSYIHIVHVQYCKLFLESSWKVHGNLHTWSWTWRRLQQWRGRKDGPPASWPRPPSLYTAAGTAASRAHQLIQQGAFQNGARRTRDPKHRALQNSSLFLGRLVWGGGGIQTRSWIKVGALVLISWSNRALFKMAPAENTWYESK